MKPETLKIGYRNYKVEEIDGDVIDDGLICYGAVNFENQVIRYSTKYSKEHQECTLLHECLHAIDEFCETDLTEQQVTMLAKGIYKFIQDNKEKILKYKGD